MWQYVDIFLKFVYLVVNKYVLFKLVFINETRLHFATASDAVYPESFVIKVAYRIDFVLIVFRGLFAARIARSIFRQFFLFLWASVRNRRGKRGWYKNVPSLFVFLRKFRDDTTEWSLQISNCRTVGVIHRQPLHWTFPKIISSAKANLLTYKIFFVIVILCNSM